MNFELFNIIRIVIFTFCTIFFIIISWGSLKNPKSHGFYRFFAFESVVLMGLLNLPFWFKAPLSLQQSVSWILFIISILVVVQGYLTLKKRGGSLIRITESENFPFENTTNLVSAGIYRHIRHPMYSSLLYFSLGILLKHVTPLGILMFLLVLIFLIATAKVEEGENIKFFGPPYEEYIKNTKRFIPFLL